MYAPPLALVPPPAASETIKRVVVVDDSLAHLRLLQMLLTRWGLDVQTATSGVQALALCRETTPDLVISDWMMPGMTGLEFCRHFRSLSRSSYGYFILLTSKSGKEEIAAGLDAGADDFATKPINGQELRARINAGARILAMERELNEKNRVIADTLRELQKVYDSIEKDLQQAHTIQQSLVPKRFHDYGRACVSLLLKSCGHVGGDLVGMFSPGFDRLCMYNFDVSGHGITSALMAARVAGYLSSDFPEQNLGLEKRFDRFFAMRRPATVARLLNQRLCNDPGVAEYLTMNYLTADLTNGRVRILQAGHPAPLLMRADGNYGFLGNGGMPVGLLTQATYDDFEVILRPGDRLLFYSDGLTECEMADGSMLDQDGLLALIHQIAPRSQGTEFLDDLYWQLESKRGPRGDNDDDISAALLEFTG